MFFIEKDALHDAIECLTTALEVSDSYTSGHSTRVADMTQDIARNLGMRGIRLKNIHLAAHLHDIGKLGIPEHILNKEEKLLPYEWEQIKRHPEIGYNILNKSKRLHQIAEIVLYHHERWDGRGYPEGIKQERIPVGSRIIAVADSIDAMTSQRPYREAMSWEECRKELMVNQGIQFDPIIVEEGIKLMNRWQIQFQTQKQIKTIKEIS
ncbi:metal dependent phosphohydrolase [Syntrophobotulus glycolicus DSM 8271]|uniref:Metal dependent phosphohydrolase n=1 Tax=Syntrophobotulus glycolicus (strain DSM 8271 / FlGlyR) TaxID=645991 RepID=F0SXB2_SYNGF|nr:HD-GYP domain-containing protein [Syntrophobotulus glycolicus]ADY56972.1 metal dependent phosphohydrolase [Syntrophobotulus glycolicus DSM 8271]